jgi:DNA-binding NarL/FixJ family response regulator
VAFGASISDADLLMCARAGVSGVVSCDAGLDELKEAVCRAARGEFGGCERLTARAWTVLGKSARQQSADRLADSRLTPREVQICRLIDRGCSNKQIASELFIELSTVKNHVHNLLLKLGVRNRWQAAAKARHVS